MQLQEHIFDAGSVNLNYAAGPPNGPPLVLLHGGSARWQGLRPIIFDLAARWHVYAPDLRGHGESGRTPGRYTLQDYTDDVIAFLNHLSEPACVFGHSLGGGIALLVAAQNPNGVRAVAVGDAPLTRETWHTAVAPTYDRIAAWRDLAGGQRPLSEVIEALKDAPTEMPGRDAPLPMREKYGEDAPVFEWLATNLYHNDPDMLTVLLDDFDAFSTGYEMDHVLPAVRCPALLLQADPASGGLMTDAEVERALLLLARPVHVRLEVVSHFLYDQGPEPVLRALTDFFGSI